MLLLAVLAAGLALLSLLTCFRQSPRTTTAVLVLVVASGVVRWVVTPPAESLAAIPETFLPAVETDQDFVSSNACVSCHPGEHASWHETFHRTMTQVASPESVLASFDDVELESRGRKYRLWRDGDEYWIRLVDPDWERETAAGGIDPRTVDDPPVVNRRIVLTTGSHHLQDYWIPSKNGRELHHVPFEWHIADKRWVPFEDAHISPPDGEPFFVHWNSNCIKCHSLGGNPGLNPQSGRMFTTVAEFGISCEACHGPGENHIRHHRNPVNRYRQHLSDDRLGDPTIVNPARIESKKSVETCAQCHSTFLPKDFHDNLVHGERYRAGEDLFQNYRMLSFVKPDEDDTDDIDQEEFYWSESDVRDSYWADGTARVGGREFLGLLATACYQRGELSCLSCHSMHNSDPAGQMQADKRDNRACLQCHQEYSTRLEEHTHHSPDSSGSLCYNCHMPHTTYALFRGIPSHRIVSPQIAASVPSSKPNACNLCHLDQTLQWTASHLQDWYGLESRPLSQDEQQVAASLLWLLKGDAAQRVITAWHMGWPTARAAAGEQWQAPFLAELLNDPYSAVRFVAGDSLNSLPGFEHLNYDFVGTTQHRIETRQAVIDNWTNTYPQSDDSSSTPRLLIDAASQVDSTAVESLLQQRDDRPISISE